MRIQSIDPIVKTLRRAGWRVNVRHERWSEYRQVDGKWVPFVLEPAPNARMSARTTRGRRGSYGTRISTHGGRVTVILTAPDGNVYEGIATCSRRDNFVRRVGTAMALGRALAEARAGGQGRLWQ